jgi:hypothetical protein
MPYTGPYKSGEEAIFSHAWNDPDEYTIKVKVKDEFEGESKQTSLKVKISKNRAATNSGLFQFIQNLLSNQYSLIEFIMILLRM